MIEHNATSPGMKTYATLPLEGRRAWAALLVVCAGFFVILLDQTMVSVATPALQEDFGASYNAILWVSSLYLLTFAVPMLFAGRLGDSYGPKRIFAVGLAIVAVSSLICALAPNITILIAARGLLGVGAALATPQTNAVITRIFPRHRLGTAFSMWAAASSLANLLGPVIGGAVTSMVGWRFVFLLTVPLAVVVLIAAVGLLPEITPTKQRIDMISVALSIAAVLFVVVALQQGQPASWPWWIFALLLIGAATVIVFCLRQRQLARDDSAALIPLRLFRVRSFSLGSMGIFLMGLAVAGTPLPIMLFLQQVHGLSPAAAGLVFAPMSLLSALLAPVVGGMVNRGDPLRLAAIGFFVTATGFALVVWVLHVVDNPWWAIFPLTVLGLGNALVWTPLSTASLSELPGEDAGAGSGVFNTTKQLGAVLGAALIAAVIQVQLVHHSEAAAFGNAIIIGAVATLLAAVLTAIFLPKRKKNGHRVAPPRQRGAQWPLVRDKQKTYPSMPLSPSGAWPALVAMCIGFFMILLDQTIVAVATPDLQSGMGASYNEVIWVTSVYLLTFAVPLLVAARLGDRFGPKNVYVIGMALFTVSSLACGLAPDMLSLIIARGFQGLGAALLTPQTMSVINRVFPRAKLGTALGVWGATAGLATLSGPLFGGIIVEFASWHWVFFINVPIGIISIFAALRFVPNFPPLERHLDGASVLVSVIAVFLVVFALQEGQSYDWAWWIFAVLVIGLVLIVAFLGLQNRAAAKGNEPLIPLEVFSFRNFSVGNLAIFCMGFVVAGTPLPLMLYFQQVHGMSPLAAGMMMVPQAVVSMLLSPLAGYYVDRLNPILMAAIGFGILAVSTVILVVTLQPGLSWWWAVPPLAIQGVSQALIWSPTSTTTMKQLPRRFMGAASGVFNTTRQLGSVLGAAGVGAVMQIELASGQDADPAKAFGWAILLTAGAAALATLATAFGTNVNKMDIADE